MNHRFRSTSAVPNSLGGTPPSGHTPQKTGSTAGHYRPRSQRPLQGREGAALQARSCPPHSGTHRWPAAVACEAGRPRKARLCDVRAQCARAGRAHPRTQTVRVRWQAEQHRQRARQKRRTRAGHAGVMTTVCLHTALPRCECTPTSFRGLVSSSSAQLVMGACIFSRRVECAFTTTSSMH